MSHETVLGHPIRLRVVLGNLALLVAALPACSSSSAVATCGSAAGDSKAIELAPDVACSLAANLDPQATSPFVLRSFACVQACGATVDDAGVLQGKAFGVCELPQDYVLALRALPDAGASSSDAGAPRCPTVSRPVALSCRVDCTGRRTAGIDEPPMASRRDAGGYLAACAYLEAVSVHAFARLATELDAHGAPASLVEAARRAGVEEERHADVVAALARRHGGSPQRPERPRFVGRSLFALAIENAVEGCVRETYGAALAKVAAQRAVDLEVRDALAIIAEEECGHAELAWDIAAWAHPRLSAAERVRVAEATSAAVAGLLLTEESLCDETRAVCGVPSTAEQRALAQLLERHVFHSGGAAPVSAQFA